MSSRIEILNDGGLRSDGRRPLELRAVQFSLSPAASSSSSSFTAETLGTSDGSASVSMGLTRVRAAVFGPRESLSRAQALHNRASVNVEVVMPPFASADARRRRPGARDRRTQELATSLRETFQPAILTALYPRASIDIHVHVLQSDGGLLAASINAASLALVAAGVPLRDTVCAVSAGVHTATPLLDLSALEENDVPHATVAVLPRSGGVALVSMKTRLHVDRFGEMFEKAGEAAKVLAAEMKKAIGDRSERLLAAMAAGAGAGGGTAEGDDDAMALED
ncbi:ribosomal protein S5 domain 2-like protein [Peniophora sp. CONT]|nr:ribosomal protein S5 domain 2-like protein [Peniophora sp. CONT]